MGSDFIPDLQGVHQHSLEWPGGANAPMHPPVSAPVDQSDYKNSVIGLSYTFVKVTENKQISLVDTNLNIVC